jgi:tetratricopeptide (TPR) repeat protein
MGRPPHERGAGRGLGAAATRLDLLLSIALIAGTLAVYAQVIGFEFVTWDDPLFVTSNAQVQRGLTADGFVYALSAPIATMWHPLTILSHMLDVELYGLDPAGHHLTSVALHILNTLLLFWTLQSMTDAPWRCAFVAAVFAVHPLHVESVAWVAERKDVLSIAFGLLSIRAYVAYAKRGGSSRYALVIVLFAFALLAKPMLVTLPFLLLLLDYWPLGRHTTAGGGATLEAQGEAAGAPGDPRRRSAVQLLVEKLPLLCLSAVASIATFTAHRGAGTLEDGARVSMTLRAANAVVSYVRYIGKAIWPVDLAPLYPHPNLPGGTPWTPWQILGAITLLALLTLSVILARRRYAVVGWLWYLGVLVPVLGLVQVGQHAMADRYTYLSLVGLLIIVAWSGAELASRRPGLRPLIAAIGVGVVVASMASARQQARVWRDSLTLYEHALALAPAAPLMRNNLGTLLNAQGRVDEAIHHYRWALRVNPEYASAHNNLANALRARGETDEAVRHYRRAVEIEPRLATAHNGLGQVLQGQGELDQAIDHFRRALEVAPEAAELHNNLGVALAMQRELGSAVAHFEEAIELEPRHAHAHSNLANVLVLQGNLEHAVQQYRVALEISPDSVQVHRNAGRTLHALGRYDEAITHYRKALELDPDASARASVEAALDAARRASGEPGATPSVDVRP